MSTKIELFFKEAVHPDLLKKGMSLRVLRIFAMLSFKSAHGWTEYYPGIVDTGAPISVLPKRVWQKCEAKKLAETELRGVIPRKVCFLPVTVSEVTCVLADAKQISEPFNIKAYLAPTDNVQLLIGCLGLLDSLRFCMDYPNKKVWVEQK